MAVSSDFVPWFQRLGIALGLFFRALFDGRAAARFLRAMHPEEAAEPPSPEPEPAAREPDVTVGASAPEQESALVLLGLLQTEGRLVDFVQQDISQFDDAEVGAVARVVHSGCRRVVERCLPVEKILPQEEGSLVDVGAVPPEALQWIGHVGAEARSKGRLQHCGWRATAVQLPVAASAESAAIVCPAQVEVEAQS